VPLRFINPNFHVILIHYPLGVFVLGVFIELFGFLWSRSGVRTAARWMIGIGALLSIPAAVSGIWALWDVKHNQGLTSASYEMLRMHVIYMGSATILAVLCAIIGIGSSDVWRKRLHFPLLLGVVAAWALMVLGAWHGGETIYQNGTAVAILKAKSVEQSDGTSVKMVKQIPLKVPEETPSMKKYEDVEKYYMGGRLQNHFIMAGFAFAAALGALALAMRRTHSNSLGREIIVERTPAMRPRRSGTNDLSVIQSFNPETEVSGDRPSIPSGRFWLFAALVLIATAGLGYWAMTNQDFFHKSGWDYFLSTLKEPTWKTNRYLAHVVLGVSILVIALICAILAVAAPRSGLLLGFFGLLLILAIAGQIWMGVLLTFDVDKEGPLTRFNRPEDNTTETMVQPIAPPGASAVAVR